MAFFKSKDKFSIFQRKHETYLYELVMEEIANNEFKDTKSDTIYENFISNIPKALKS